MRPPQLYAFSIWLAIIFDLSRVYTYSPYVVGLGMMICARFLAFQSLAGPGSVYARVERSGSGCRMRFTFHIME